MFKLSDIRVSAVMKSFDVLVCHREATGCLSRPASGWRWICSR